MAADELIDARTLALSAPESHSLFTIRLVRAADVGMDVADISWLEQTDGTLRSIEFAEAGRPEIVRTFVTDAGRLHELMYEAFGAPRRTVAS